jgi:hypothetical protein
MAQHAGDFVDTLDTYVLNDGVGGGVHAMTFPLQAEILSRTDSALAIWRSAGMPDSAGMTTVTQQLATHAYDVISQWPQVGDLMLTPIPVNDLTLRFVSGVGLRLRWSEVTENIWGWQQNPASGYSIWHMSVPGGAADSIGYTTGTEFIVPGGAGADKAFYLVKARS